MNGGLIAPMGSLSRDTLSKNRVCSEDGTAHAILQVCAISRGQCERVVGECYLHHRQKQIIHLLNIRAQPLDFILGANGAHMRKSASEGDRSQVCSRRGVRPLLPRLAVSFVVEYHNA